MFFCKAGGARANPSCQQVRVGCTTDSSLVYRELLRHTTIRSTQPLMSMFFDHENQNT